MICRSTVSFHQFFSSIGFSPMTVLAVNYSVSAVVVVAVVVIVIVIVAVVGPWTNSERETA